MLAVVLAILFAVFPACPTEDATDCAWDASTHGNGTGSSFVDINGTAYYIER